MTGSSAARLLFWLAAAFAVGMALLPHPPQLVETGDKAQHMAAFAVLAVLAVIAWPMTPVVRVGERLSFLGALIEVFQSIPALRRDCDPLDWLADTGAIVVALTIVMAIRCRKSFKDKNGDLSEERSPSLILRDAKAYWLSGSSLLSAMMMMPAITAAAAMIATKMPPPASSDFPSFALARADLATDSEAAGLAANTGEAVIETAAAATRNLFKRIS